MTQYFSDTLQQLQEQAQASELIFRRDALNIFQDYGLPHRKQDPWKYVNNEDLLNLPIKKLPEDESTSYVPDKIPQHESMQTFYFHNDAIIQPAAANGKTEKNSKNVHSRPTSYAQVQALDIPSDLNSNPAKWHLDKKSLMAEENSYSLINALSFRYAYEIKLCPSKIKQSPPPQNVILHLHFSGNEHYQAPRIYIDIPEGTNVSVLIDSSQLGCGFNPEANANVYWNPYFFVSLGENAHLTLVERGPRILRDYQKYERKHVRSVSLRGRVAAGAQVNAALFYWGIALAVHDTRFTIYGEAANVQMSGICFGEGLSQYHMRCENQHSAPNSQSNCLYKNILFDKAISEFYGIIRADNQAVGTDANQKNQNLLLSNEARAIARPQLEILIDDLQCGHGSSTGSIDAEELFYMRSRGLDQTKAMQLAVIGFVEEISTYFEPNLLHILEIEDCLHVLLNNRDYQA